MSEQQSASKNRLAGESSPYLLLHQSNPVDWYPWGEEALLRARQEDKPIFLSVGYSTCYWCHVMERESFSDPDIAALMNKNFVNIKVDREERPDLDEIYMAATQLLTQHGGWPNSVFLTPKLEPFFAGTYFPPKDRYGRPGFASVVVGLADSWKNRRAEVEQQAEELAAAMRHYLEERFEPGEAPPPPAAARRAAAALAQHFDPEWGGFGGAPKFPTPSNLLLLQELADDDREAARMLTATLDQMARGGLCDQLAGGFHRYATDREWKVPHFEKMLYDNGLLLLLYAREHQRTGAAEWGRVARQTADFLSREMTTPQGAFASAIDAETDGEEGAYYVWRREELEAVLGVEDATFLAPLLGFAGPPFFEGDRYVLHLPQPWAEAARQRRMSRDELLAEIEPLRTELLAARARRPRPLTDDKVLADWNGLAIAGMAAAGRALDDPDLVARAAAAADFVLTAMRAGDGPLLHAWRGGEGKLPAYLADYAYLVWGLLELVEVSGEARWLQAAVALTEEQIERLGDAESGGFFVAAPRPDLLLRSKEVFDGATPSANAVAVLNLQQLARRTGEPRWNEAADRALAAFAPLVEQVPDAVRTLTLAAYRRGAGEGTATGSAAEAAAGGVAQEGAGGEGGPAAAGAVAAAERQAAEVVELTLELGEPGGDGWRPFRLRLSVADGWHLNAHPTGDESLVATTVDGDGAELREVSYPDGRSFGTAASEAQRVGELAVYEGEVTIHGELRAGGEGAALIVTYQPCDDRRCLPPVRRRCELSKG